MASEEESKIHPRPRRSRRRPTSDQRFSSYLSFGFHATVCLGVFLVCYAALLLGLFPLLQQAAPESTPTRRGEVLKPVVDHAVENVKHHMPVVPGQIIAEGVAGAVKKKIANFRKTQGMTDASLMQKAAEEFARLRKRREESVHDVVDLAPIQPAPGKRSGFMVLGMHRSGTSMLSGLLVTGLGYTVGGPLIGGAFDNEKGFFELIPAVLQNDEFMKHQKVYWSHNVIAYDADKALEHKKSGIVDFKEYGEKALKFMNNPKNAPWLQKDPRMCITLKTWLPLLNSEPAIVFTYRHPLEVALSLKKRENNFGIDRGLRLWIVYNMRAIQNSKSLCMILSSNEAVLHDPLSEVQRISDELTSKCGVPEPPRKLTQEDVDKFVDPNLQHNKKKRQAEDAEKEVIAEYDGCKVREFKSSALPESVQAQREQDLYLKAMKVFCDFQSGKAYKDDYEWPDLT